MDQVTWFRTKRGQVTWICKIVDQITWAVLLHWVRLPGTHAKAGLFMGTVRVRVLLPQALRRARRGGRHRLGVDTLDLGDRGDIRDIYGRCTVGEIHCLGVDALPRPLTCFAASRFTRDVREIYRRYSTLDLLRAIGLGLGGRGGLWEEHPNPHRYP